MKMKMNDGGGKRVVVKERKEKKEGEDGRWR